MQIMMNPIIGYISFLKSLKQSKKNRTKLE